ncbi:MAG: hypothetical protein K0U38_06175 [Epsilonproteobacteria bacterium]|nr:hypothetical protein [Campylobacterota bacterium]
MIKSSKLSLIGILICLGTYSMADSNVSVDKNSTTKQVVPTKEKVVEVKEPVVKQPVQEKSSDSMEEQIKKAMAGVEQITVLKSAEPKIVSESEAMVLDAQESKTVVAPMRKKIKKSVKKRVKKRIKRKVETVDFDSLPMAKTYPMDYDVSKIKE